MDVCDDEETRLACQQLLDGVEQDEKSGAD